MNVGNLYLIQPAASVTRLLLVVLVALFSAAGIAVSDQATWELGPKAFSVTARSAPPLRIKSMGAASLRSFKFVARIGGVSFEAVAEPDPTVLGKPISLHYQVSRQDGRRLRVTIGAQSFYPGISDWQLKPIAEFADTEFTGVVSLFGDGPDNENTYYIQYHPAFQDTLLGLRLLQADITFIDLGHYWKLPAWNGRVALGHGEVTPRESSIDEARRTIHAVFLNKSYQSWVLTDTDTRPRIAVAGDELRLTAAPYYHFWILSDQTRAEREKNIEQHNSLVLKLQAKIDEYKPMVAERNEYIDDSQTDIDAYNALVGRHNKSTDGAERAKMAAELDALGKKIDDSERQIRGADRALDEGKKQIDEMERDLTRLQERIDGQQVTPVPELTNAIKAQTEQLRTYNPAVFVAYNQTARFAAFFRYVKMNFPDAWSRFMGQMRALRVQPEVITPTSLAR